MHQIETLLLIEEIITVRTTRGGSIVLGGCGYWRLTAATMDSTTPKHIWVELVGLSGSM